MYVWQGNIVDEAGNVIPSAVIDVLYAGTSTRPTIYADSSGTALANLETGANYANMIYSFSIDSWVWNVAGSQVARMASNFFGPSTTDDAYLLGRSTNRFSDGYITQLRPGDGTPIWTSGSGSPESAVTAPVGSLYTRTDGGASTTLYVKESGTGNTGWVAK